MKTKSILMAALSPLLLMACSSDDATANVAGESRVPLMLGSTIDGAATRSATNIQNTRFDVSSVIDVQIEPTAAGDHTVYDLLQYQVADASGTLTPVKKVYPYYPVSGSSVNIYAIYPSGNLDVSTFSVKTAQLNKDNYKASDLIYGEVLGQAAQQEVVTIPFRHLLSKVIVNLEAGDNGEDIEGSLVNLLGVATTIGLNGRGVLGDAVASSRTTVNMSTDGSMSSAAVIVPQEVPSGVLIEVQLQNHDIVNYKTPQTMIFESGKKYTFNIKVVEETLVATCSVEPWAETEDLEQDIKL